MNQAADAWLMRGITKKVRESLAFENTFLMRQLSWYFSHVSIVTQFC